MYFAVFGSGCVVRNYKPLQSTRERNLLISAWSYRPFGLHVASRAITATFSQPLASQKRNEKGMVPLHTAMLRRLPNKHSRLRFFIAVVRDLAYNQSFTESRLNRNRHASRVPKLKFCEDHMHSMSRRWSSSTQGLSLECQGLDACDS